MYDFTLKKHHILIISMMVFVVLNLIENYLHYNVGRNAKNETNVSNGTNFKLYNPNIKDWILIAFFMILFAFLQGLFTEYFSDYY